MTNQPNKSTIQFTDPRTVRLVQACMGNDDVRDYLNYMLLDLDQNILIGTNGHVMAKITGIDNEHGLRGRHLIQFDSKIPKNWDRLVFDLETGIATGYKKDAVKGRAFASVVDEKEIGTFPDVERVIPPKGRKYEGCNQISFDADYLTKIIAAVGNGMVRLLIDDYTKPLIIEFSDGELNDVSTVVLMPARI